MPKFLQDAFFTRRKKASDFVLICLVTAVSFVLVTRLFLKISGFPQIHHGSLHIAHVLWGGLLMLLGGLTALSFYGKYTRYGSAILLGAGFGLFIDEAGKFITNDNNYFYQPAAVIIYLSFLILFFVYHYFDNIFYTSAKTCLYQALEQLEDVIEGDFEQQEKELTLSLLEEVERSKNDIYKEFARSLAKTVKSQPSLEDKLPPSWLLISRKFFHSIYDHTLKRKWFLYILGIIFIFNGIESLLTAVSLIFNFGNLDAINQLVANFDIQSHRQALMLLIQVFSSVVTAVLVFLGVYYLKKDHLKALKLFSYGLVVKILITHVFTFYFEQFSATLGVFLDLLLLYGIYYLIEENRKFETEDINNLDLN